MDLGLFILEDGPDIVFEKGDIKLDEGLETAVLISLFSDRRVSSAEIPFGQTSPRGWWGDLFAEEAGDRIGSKLWLFAREKTSVQTANRIQQEMRNALQWLIDDSIASQVNVFFTIVTRFQIDFTIEIIKNNSDTQRFDVVWEGQELRRA